MRARHPQAVAGIALAAVCAALFVDWFLHAAPLTPAAVRQSVLLASSSLAFERFAPDVAQRIRGGLALTAIAGCLLGAFVFHRAPASAAARQVAWMLVGYAAYVFVAFFAGVDARYSAPLPAGLLSGVSVALLVGLVLAAARFLVIFPREVDAESAWRSYWLRRFSPPGAAHPLLDHWHAGLRRGTVIWVVPLALVVLSALWPLLETPAYSWRGVYVVVYTTAALFLGFVGIPFAFASTTHIYRNGNDEERRRVAWLRGVLLLTAIAVAAGLAASIAVTFLLRGQPRASLMAAGAAFLFWQLLPSAFIAALAFAVLYRGALDPRIAITRVTLWSVLGLGVTLVFLVVERVVAVKAAQWLGLPTETGLVMAGAAVAATFFPLRRAVDHAVRRLADRLLPIAVVADGVHVQRVVAITDLSGYTALAARDQAAALMQGALLKRQAARLIAPYEGRLVKSMGDAVMLTFASAQQALGAVRALHRAYPGAAGALALEPLPLHSALHRGEIVESHDGDIYGQTVNVTVRLVDAAAPGEVVMSDAVRAELGESQAAVDIGERRFKNVPQAMRCFRLVENSP